VVTSNVPLPADAEFLGWIDRHPSDKEGPGYTIVRLQTGNELARNGRNFRSLPQNWRKLVPFAETVNSSR
jgi:hypothetical protein